jgi:hypothetical protein
MIYRLAADIVVLVHFGFILFVVGGGLLVLRWPKTAFVHVPCAVWGVVIILGGWICPLTPLEQHLRALAGSSGYSGGFIDHYVMLLIYPPGLTRTVQAVLGIIVLLANLCLYGWVFKQRAQKRKERTGKGLHGP